jgi:hypothetical protein
MTGADNNDALAARIALIEDREQITDLVFRYTECVRDRCEGAIAELMTEDACVELHHADALAPGQSECHERFVGREEILGSFGKVAGEMAVVWPMIHNLRIELDGDEARSRCVMVSSLRPHGLQFIAEYRDTFRRVDGTWLFATRTFVGIGDLEGKSGEDVHADWQKIKV